MTVRSLQTHVILENDCPDEAQDDGRFPINDIRNVYVDQFDLENKTGSKVRVWRGGRARLCGGSTVRSHVQLWPSESRGPSQCCSCAETFRGLSHGSADTSRVDVGGGGHETISWWDNVRRTHQALAAHHLQQVQQSGAIPEVLEQVQDHARRPPLSTTVEYRTNKIQLSFIF